MGRLKTDPPHWKRILFFSKGSRFPQKKSVMIFRWFGRFGMACPSIYARVRVNDSFFLCSQKLQVPRWKNLEGRSANFRRENRSVSLDLWICLTVRLMSCAYEMKEITLMTRIFVRLLLKPGTRRSILGPWQCYECHECHGRCEDVQLGGTVRLWRRL